MTWKRYACPTNTCQWPLMSNSVWNNEFKHLSARLQWSSIMIQPCHKYGTWESHLTSLSIVNLDRKIFTNAIWYNNHTMIWHDSPCSQHLWLTRDPYSARSQEMCDISDVDAHLKCESNPQRMDRMDGVKSSEMSFHKWILSVRQISLGRLQT